MDLCCFYMIKVIFMTDSKMQENFENTNPIDEYFQCLSYCDIHPKGIDNDCEVICMERHLKANYW